MTAPGPPLPKARPSTVMHEIRTCRSAAGPTAMAPVSSPPKEPRIPSIAARALRPTSPAASWKRTPLPSIESQVHSRNAPSTMRPSQPACFRRGPKSPPQLEHRYNRVSGERVASWNFDAAKSGVAVSGPVMKMSLLPGPSASVSGPISRW